MREQRKENKSLREKKGFLKERNKQQKTMLGKAQDDTDYKAKIEQLEEEVKNEKQKFREKDK